MRDRIGERFKVPVHLHQLAGTVSYPLLKFVIKIRNLLFHLFKPRNVVSYGEHLNECSL